VGATIRARVGCRAGDALLEQGQGERGSLAGAGLRPGHDVLPEQDGGDGLFLDGGGLGIALLLDRAEQLGREAEISELHAVADSSSDATASGRRCVDGRENRAGQGPRGHPWRASYSNTPGEAAIAALARQANLPGYAPTSFTVSR
jgi:hypothetical protein